MAKSPRGPGDVTPGVYPKDDKDFVPIDWKGRPEDYKYYKYSCWNPDSPQEKQRNACLAADRVYQEAERNIRCERFGDASWYRQKAANLEIVIAARVAAQEEWERTGPPDERSAMAITQKTIDALKATHSEYRAKAGPSRGSAGASGGLWARLFG